MARYQSARTTSQSSSRSRHSYSQPRENWNKVIASAALAAAPVLLKGILRRKFHPVAYSVAAFVGMSVLNRLSERIMTDFE